MPEFSPDIEEYSVAREVWKQYRKSFSAMLGLVIILLLVAVALCAPLLANGAPLLARLNGKLSSPALSAMIAPESTEIFVSKAFNFLLFAIPLCVILISCCGNGSRKFSGSSPFPCCWRSPLRSFCRADGWTRPPGVK